MECLICDMYFDTDLMQHIRLMHPDILDQKTEREILSLQPVTAEMHDDDLVCERCDRQFRIGMVFGESFEGMYRGNAIVSLICGTCFTDMW
jgi:hypothetical protein